MDSMKGPSRRAGPDDRRHFAIVLGGVIAISIIALVLGALLQTPPLSQIAFSKKAVIIGIIAPLPPLAFNAWLARTKNAFFTRFRETQLALFASLGFALTPMRMVLLAVAAGVGEEFLFRGVLQTLIDGYAPVWAAIVIPNILFALLHAHNALYAVAAGIMGVYFGVAFAATGDLTAPILTHGLYDLGALEMTRRAMRAYRPRVEAK